MKSTHPVPIPRSRIVIFPSILALVLGAAFSSRTAGAQSACTAATASPRTNDTNVLAGLAQVTVLPKTPAGKVALAVNYVVTGDIQTGVVRQPTLLPFAVQQQQALRDASITSQNLSNLADGLGTTLGAAYLTRFHSLDRNRGTPLPTDIVNVVSYANTITYAHSNEGKYLFGNGTSDGANPASPEKLAIVKDAGGQFDVFGVSYSLPAGAAGADPCGNSRPFQTIPDVLRFVGPDYFNLATGNVAYNRGPLSDLTKSPSYPSGHTTYGYTGALLLAVLVPSRYQEMMVRAAEYGNDRILMGAHYAMDVIAGRTLATYDLAHLLANDPNYVYQTLPGVTTVTDFRGDIVHARACLRKFLEDSCGAAISDCAHQDLGRFNNPAANEAFYASTQTYNLPAVDPTKVTQPEDVDKIAPDAGWLLVAAFPSLTLPQANQILTETEGPGGGFLDDGKEFGIYSRLNLYAAAGRAAQLAPYKAADDPKPDKCDAPPPSSK
jgi:hypothetical protein